jgi:hypothetical protein
MKNTTVDIDNKLASVAKTSLEKLKYDYDLMLDYSIKRGIPLPKQLILDNSKLNNDELVSNYNDLTNSILPTTVESITYINNYMFSNSAVKKWYQIPIYSKSLFISILALLAVIAISLSPDVNNENLSKGLLASSGKTLFYNLSFICSSSLLGVMFYSMKSMNEKIKSYTLTQVHVLELNSVILVGVISGFLISEVFSSIVTSGFKDSVVITKMTLSILGGFSSDAIFSILQGLVNKIKALLTPSL